MKNDARENSMILYVRHVLIVQIALFMPTLAAYGADALPHSLAMEEAITRGLQANVDVVSAWTRVNEADGTRERKLSAYLPHVHIETPVAYQTRNLKAQGISFPNVPEVVGPFTSFDFRAYADQSLFDLQSYHTIKASEKDKQARRNDYEDVRSRVIRQVAVNYLAAQYEAAKVETALSRVRTSEALEKLARDQHDAGLADGLDVLRAQVQLANDRQNLLVSRNSAELALLALARSIGVELGTPLALADKLAFRKLEAPQIEEAVKAALESRPDYRSLFSQRESLDEQIKSSRSRYLPKVAASGNYGGSGQELGDLQPSWMIGVNLTFTLFDMDRSGERLELDSRLQRIDDQIADQRRGVEQDIREALLNLESAAQQVAVAGSGLELAERELQFSSDRFKNGVANNIEVITAQDSLARAYDNRLNALVQHADAKIALARALGNTEKVYRLFLGILSEGNRP
jgi:outer membrane protein TolC